MLSSRLTIQTRKNSLAGTRERDLEGLNALIAPVRVDAVGACGRLWRGMVVLH
jgi:hypothetical protein